MRTDARAPLSLIDPPSAADVITADRETAVAGTTAGWVDIEIPLSWDDAAHTLHGRAPWAECPLAVVGTWRLEWETGHLVQSPSHFYVVRQATQAIVAGPLPLADAETVLVRKLTTPRGRA